MPDGRRAVTREKPAKTGRLFEVSLIAQNFPKKILHGKWTLLISASLSPENERASNIASR
jgi:hypothetical protein